MAGRAGRSRGHRSVLGFPGSRGAAAKATRVDRRAHRRPRHRQGRQPKGAFEPGADIHAKVTIFADGVRGNLTKQLYARSAARRRGASPPQFAIGIKELWDIPKDRLQPGTVIHTLGYPLRRKSSAAASSTRCRDGRISIGFVVGLDYHDPLFDPHAAFQHFKRIRSSQHPRGRLACVRYGAKALPEGGWNTQPHLYVDGALIVGDAGEFRELDAAEGHPPGDAERDAGGRDRVRRGSRRRYVARRRCRRTSIASTRARSRRSCIRSAMSTRRSAGD